MHAVRSLVKYYPEIGRLDNTCSAHAGYEAVLQQIDMNHGR